MNIDDIKLKTLSGEPVLVENYKIYPRTLREVTKLGYDNYNVYLSLFCIQDDYFEEFKKQVEQLKKDYNVTYLDYLVYLYNKSDVKDIILDTLTYFIGEKFYYNNNGFFYCIIKINDKDSIQVLNDNILKDIIEIIKVQNCLLDEEIENTKENPANSHVAALLEKRKKAREKLRKAKKNNSDEDEEGLSLYDLASIVASNCNGINIFNVWDMNFIQFNDQLNRMKMLDEYSVNIQALLAGADSKNINLTHWMSKIKHNED